VPVTDDTQRPTLSLPKDAQIARNLEPDEVVIKFDERNFGNHVAPTVAILANNQQYAAQYFDAAVHIPKVTWERIAAATPSTASIQLQLIYYLDFERRATALLRIEKNDKIVYADATSSDPHATADAAH